MNFKVTMAFASCLVLSASHAETFIPIPPNGGMTLGSGVNILKPDEALPSCFKSTPKPLDPPDAARKYEFSVKAVSSVDEVNRLRSRGAQVGGSYGPVSAKLQAWESTQSSDKRASLYVVIEARFIGPRFAADDVSPRHDRKVLLESGSADEIFKMCGTHVVAVEHRGQALRVVIDLRQADTFTKQEIGTTFGAKASFAIFQAGASGNYKSAIERLAKEKKVDILVEGTGTPPNAAEVTELLKSNAGDLNSVAEALGKLLATAKPGSPGSYVGYGVSLQPLYFYSKAATTNLDSQQATAALDTLLEYTAILGSQLSQLKKARQVIGLPADRKVKLDQETTEIRKALDDLKIQSIACLVGKDSQAKTCEEVADFWGQSIRAGRDISTAIDVGADEVILKTTLPTRSHATLVGRFDDNYLALESFVLGSGSQQTRLLKIATTPMPALVKLQPTPPDFIHKVHTYEIDTSAPLFFSASVAAWVMAGYGGVQPSALHKIFIGCNGVFLMESSQKPKGALDLRYRDWTKFSDESICRPNPFAGPPPMPTIFEFVPMFLMPPGLMPLAVSPLPARPVELYLSLVDANGLDSFHFLTGNLGALLGGPIKKMGY